MFGTLSRAQRSVTVNKESQPAAGTDGTEILAWMDEAYPIIRTSRWASALTVDGIDLLDALISQVYLEFLAYARNQRSSPADRNRTMDRRLMAQRLNSRLQQLRQRRAGMRLSASVEKEAVIFWPRDITHIKQQIPVATALSEMGITARFIACKARIFDQLRAEGMSAIFTDAVWRSRISGAKKEGVSQTRILDNEPGILFPRLAGSDEQQQLIELLRNCLKTLLPAAHEAVAITRATFERISPSVLVVGNDITIEGRTACLWAKRTRMATACLMHGVAVTPLSRAHRADRILVHGEAGRRHLVKHGINSANIEVCGAPYLDYDMRQTGITDSRLRQRFGLGQGKSWVLVATSGPGNKVSSDHHQAVIENVMRLSTRFPSVTFVAKLHPKDKIEYYREAQKKFPDSSLHLIQPNESGLPTDIFYWLQGCSLVLTGASAVAVEAMLMDVPVITVDFADELSNVDFIESGATIHVKTFMELEVAMHRVLHSPEQLAGVKHQATRFLANTFDIRDGCESARRAARAIMSLVRIQ